MEEAGFSSTPMRDRARTKGRDKWGSPLEYLLSCIGYMVGLSNIWRFPYLCMRNGGGAFLVPYFLTLLLCGVPLFLLEAAVGQYGSASPITMWRICPLFKGVGWCVIISVMSFVIYYHTLATWILYYLAMSFSPVLPWTTCDNPWNTGACMSRFQGQNATDNSTDLIQVNSSLLNFTNIISSNVANEKISPKSPSEEFWQYKVLELSDGIDCTDGLRWELVLCHFAGWALIALVLVKGIKSAGKVVYVTVFLPCALLTVLLAYGCTLPGSKKGILYYVTPEWSKLTNVQIWVEACLQIFYTLGSGWGNMVAFGGYNKFHHNVFRDAFLATFACCLASFYGGFAIFAVVGYMSERANLPIQKVITSGPGLAFIVYPEALGSLPVPQVWSVLFFLTLTTLIIDTEFACIECILGSMRDEFPGYLSTPRRRRVMSGLVFAVLSLSGLIFCSRAGMYFFQVWDWFIAACAAFLVVFIECMTISWIYGAERFCKDIETMVGYSPKPKMIFKFLWAIFDPLIVLTLVIYNWFTFTTPSYGDYQYPVWANAFGWLLGWLPLIPIPCFMIYEIKRQDGSFFERLKKSARPLPEWRPAAIVSKNTVHDNCDTVLITTPNDRTCGTTVELNILATEHMTGM